MKKVFISLSAVSFLLSPLSMGTSHASFSETSITSEEADYNIQAIPGWVKAAFKLLVKTATGKLDRIAWYPAVINQYHTSTHIETGTVSFNQGNYQGSIQKELVFDQSTTQQAYIWGTRPPLITGRILIEVFRQGSNSPILSQPVAPTQQVTFAPRELGNYIIDWSTPEKQNWNLQFTYTHRYIDLPEPYSESNKFITEVVEDHVFIKPSESHTGKVSLFSKTQELTLTQLYDQLFDQELNEYVYKFKDYKIGDSIFFKDTIKKINYNSDKDATEITFSSDKHGEVIWSFAGDLSKEYSIGDDLRLQFKVEKIAGNYEMLDYINLSVLQ
ncbi:hypothetical protein ABDI30_24705 [Paenibacillus cisolokensis]|uniref:hypothetical protein n=1 Tax=Paenibacillus cisolokensis TaxID=1658519 RepID=UPI003D279A89